MYEQQLKLVTEVIEMSDGDIIIINLFAIFSYQIADIYHAMAGHQKNTKLN